MGDGLIKVGLEAATYLTNNSEKPLVYEKLMRLIFEKINEFIDVTQISIYVIDNNKKNLKEEAIYHKSGWIPGYDFIKAEDISPTLKEKRVKKFSENNYYKLQVPLHTGSQLLGLLEFRTLSPLSEKYINEIKDIASTISLGLRSVLFEADTIREEKNIQFFIDINNKLQAIDDIDELVNTFLEMTINYYKFDRITVFIFDNDNKILFAEGINEQGKKYNIDKFPLLPDVSEGKIFVDDINNYWIPLKTNTGRVGMVLFDNIYTLYNIPESLLNTLRILTSQFAKAIDNIRMFSSLQESAYYDSLTGLYSRTYLDEIIPEYDKEENIPLSIIIGDLNGLKITNDVFGHAAGDRLLIKTADILREVCPKRSLLFRWGGDEFFVLLPEKSERETYSICRKIKEKCIDYNNTEVRLSISLGYATKKNKNIEMSKLMKKAEDRMYRHKLLETKSYRSSIISSLKETLTEKSYESSSHAERMSKLAIKIGKRLNLMGSELNDLELLAVLHDIGKVAIDDEILNKTGPLNDKEWEEIKKHPEIGYRIAQASQELSHISSYILNHHERWDGTGYPLGKKGEEIPLLSRIISVVDAYDVMTNGRPYKKAISQIEALQEIERCAGTQFDPEIVKVFQSIMKITATTPGEN